MAVQLTGSAEFVSLGAPGYALRAPGLHGTVELQAPGTTAVRGARHLGSAYAALDQALRSEGVSEVNTVDLSLQRGNGNAPARVLRSAQGVQLLELEVPDLGADTDQIVMSIDDAGIVRWHLPAPDVPGAQAKAKAVRGARSKRFLLPATTLRPLVGNETPKSQQRSILGGASRRLLKVLIYPVTDPLIGPIADEFASRWEARKRPYRLRAFSPENYRNPNVPSLTREEVQRLSSGGVLLMFVHGTFSTSHDGFGGLPIDTLIELHRRYDSRVLAFDHPTLADAPVDNVRWLLSQLSETPIRMDIVAHSRGGLVARVLAERQPCFELDASGVDVRRIVFGGVPNAGTALADPDHLIAMLDRLTTLLTLLPTGTATETLEAIVTVVKMIGHGALNGLRGLRSMDPNYTFLPTLNQVGGRQTEYFAVASNYEPVDPGLRGLVSSALNSVVDHIFGDVGNDLVVPTDGVWQPNGGAGFPVDAKRLHVFGPLDGVKHTDMFQQPAMSAKLLEWLQPSPTQ